MTKEKLRLIIGGNIKQERLSRGMTIDEVSELMNLTPGFVGLIERGERGITILNLCKLTEIFGVDINRFLVEITDKGSFLGKNEDVRIK